MKTIHLPADGNRNGVNGHRRAPRPSPVAAVSLFVPCYVDQLAPHVGVATLRVLDALGIAVDVPSGQTCCGQPVANAGHERAGRRAARQFDWLFRDAARVVTPSGSCAAHVRHHYGAALGVRSASDGGVAGRTDEFVAFLHDAVGLDRLRALGLRLARPLTAALHTGCHGLRGLSLAAPSELQVPAFDKVRAVLACVSGVTIAEARRPDECCGFGGTFAVSQPELSSKIGRDRLRDLLHTGAEAVVSTDVSCTLHLEGLARRAGGAVPFFHVAEVLALGLDGAAGQAANPDGMPQ